MCVDFIVIIIIIVLHFTGLKEVKAFCKHMLLME